MPAEHSPAGRMMPGAVCLPRGKFSFDKPVGVRLLVVIYLALSHRLGKPCWGFPEKRATRSGRE
jgi:hypothetical protein